MTDDDRYIQFYIEDVGTTASRRAHEGLEVRRQFDGILGTFPRSDGERVSWYLCECEEEPIARRVRGPEHLACPVCSRRPQRVHLCTCGVASAVGEGDEAPTCPWCGRGATAESHDCRAVEGMEVVVGGVCPFCDRSLAATADEDSEPTRAAESPPSGAAEAEAEAGAVDEPEDSPPREARDRELWITHLSRNGPETDRDPDPVADEGLHPRTVEATEAPETASKTSGKLIAAVVASLLIGVILFFFASSGKGPGPVPDQEVAEATSSALSEADEAGDVAAVHAAEEQRDGAEPTARPEEPPSTGEPTPEGAGEDIAPTDEARPSPERLDEVALEEPEVSQGQSGDGGNQAEEAVSGDDGESLSRGVQLARALDALDRGDWEAALDRAETVLAENPDDPSAQAVLKRAVEAQGEIERENRLGRWRTGLKEAGSSELEEYYARRILSEDPDDPLAVRVRAQARRKAVQRSEEEAEAGNTEAVRAIWEDYQALWPNDALASVERKQWVEKAAEAAPIEEIAPPREDIPEDAATPVLDEEEATGRQRSSPSAAEVRRRTLEQLRPVKISAPWTFEMGCTRGDPDCTPLERPRHDVKITRPFRITAFETTTNAYRSCVEHGPCSPPKTPTDRANPHLPAPYEDPGKGSHPVVNVSWEQANEFCDWLGGRLPTEAEWEAAARGLLRGSRYPWSGELTHDRANFAGTGGRDQWEGTNPVGVFEANRHGLHSMLGNVREWVSDWRGNYRKTKKRPAEDPQGPASSQGKIIRGGSWKQPPEKLRVSYREWAGAIGVNDDLGFRCVIPGA